MATSIIGRLVYRIGARTSVIDFRLMILLLPPRLRCTNGAGAGVGRTRGIRVRTRVFRVAVVTPRVVRISNGAKKPVRAGTTTPPAIRRADYCASKRRFGFAFAGHAADDDITTAQTNPSRCVSIRIDCPVPAIKRASLRRWQNITISSGPSCRPVRQLYTVRHRRCRRYNSSEVDVEKNPSCQ